VSDLAVVAKLHRDGALLFAADARSVRPVSGAEIVVRQK
jgi:hypothetical protein